MSQNHTQHFVLDLVSSLNFTINIVQHNLHNKQLSFIVVVIKNHNKQLHKCYNILYWKLCNCSKLKLHNIVTSDKIPLSIAVFQAKFAKR